METWSQLALDAIDGVDFASRAEDHDAVHGVFE